MEGKIIPFLDNFSKKHTSGLDQKAAEQTFEGFLNEHINLKHQFSPSLSKKIITILEHQIDITGGHLYKNYIKKMPYELILKARIINRLLTGLNAKERAKCFASLSAHCQLYCYADNYEWLLKNPKELDIQKIQNITESLRGKNPDLVAFFLAEILTKLPSIKRENQMKLLEYIEKYLANEGFINIDLAVNLLYQCHILLQYKKYKPNLKKLIHFIMDFAGTDQNAITNVYLKQNMEIVVNLMKKV